MKHSEIVMKTDAIVYIVLSGAILAVSSILLFVAGEKFIPPLGIAFAFFAFIASFIGLVFNAVNLVILNRKSKGQ